MASSDPTDRVEVLVREAEEFISKGEYEAASRALREASSVDDSNANVKAAWEKVRKQEGGNALIDYCKTWLLSQNDDDGELVLDYLEHHRNLSKEVQEEAMMVMLEYSGDSDMADHITGILLKTLGAKRVLAKHLQESPTVTFNKTFERGDDTMDGQTSLLLDPTAWNDETVRIASERDVFQLCLAFMMKAGQDFPDRAMKPISRLLGAEASNLNGLMDADGFDVILSNLDIRLPEVLRTHATIACVKLLELSPDSGSTLISQYVVKRVQRPTLNSLIQAFSAAAAIFPMAPQAAAELFLTAGFLDSLVKLATKWKSNRLDQAALELLNAACMDKACRESIRRYCLLWLNDMSNKSTDAKKYSQANLILQKIKDAHAESERKPTSDPAEDERAQSQLVSGFKSTILSDDNDDSSGAQSNALEGLAYASIKPLVKEDLANDPDFLKVLIKRMNDSKSVKTTVFGGLSLLANLTAYRPVLSEEQKKLTELKAYANTEKPSPPDALDDDERVTIRCLKVLLAGAVPFLVTQSKNFSPTTRSLALQILNSLSKERKHRSALAQQGALKLLLQIHESLTSYPSTAKATAQADSLEETSALTAAHAMARILISVNPSHAFTSSSPPLTSAIRPLTSLLSLPASDGPRNLLPTFEGLLALTNLASIDDNARDAIIRQAWPALEDLLLQQNKLVQRAAVELVCNLSASPLGVAKFGDDSTQATTRLRILIALSDVDDNSTRSAAAGALAMLTEWDRVVAALLKLETGVTALLRLCGDESADVAIRGAVALRNLLRAPGDSGVQAREKVKSPKEAGLRILEDAQRKGDQAVKECLEDVLSVLR